MTGYVYAIAAGDLVKIGYSADPGRRLNKLEADNGQRCELLGVVPSTFEQEQELHQLLAPWCERGEWYRRGSRPVEYLISSLRPLPSKEREVPANAHPVKAWRLEAGMSQGALASAIQMDRSHLAKVESWKARISAPVAARLSAFTGIPIADLANEVLQ